MIKSLILLILFFTSSVLLCQEIDLKENWGDEEEIEAFSLITKLSDTNNAELRNIEKQYLEDSISHRMKVLHTQHIISIVIFIVVILIVLSGLFFAGKHFFVFISSKKLNAQTQIEITAQGIKLKSSILGIVILTLSIMFFYMYLIHVYPIKEIHDSDIGSNNPIEVKE